MNGERGSGGRLYVAGKRPSALPAIGERAGRVDWWTTRYGRWRLAIEREAMERFDDFSLVEDTWLQWRGTISSSLTGDTYRLEVGYPYEFPDAPPVARIEGHQFPQGTPHLLEGNRPCLYRHDDGARGGYDPARTTAATIVAWTALWIHAYETWRATKAWPGLEA